MHYQLRKECLKKFRLVVFVSEISPALAALTCSISVTTIQLVLKYNRTLAFFTKLRNRPYILTILISLQSSSKLGYDNPGIV